MLKKSLYSLIAIVFIGVIAWEYKVNILIWSIPKVAAIFMPVQENIPTSWSEGPEAASEDERPNIILILADDMGLGKTTSAVIASIIENNVRTLIVCPASLKINWKREIENGGYRF